MIGLAIYYVILSIAMMLIIVFSLLFLAMIIALIFYLHDEEDIK